MIIKYDNPLILLNGVLGFWGFGVLMSDSTPSSDAAGRRGIPIQAVPVQAVPAEGSSDAVGVREPGVGRAAVGKGDGLVRRAVGTGIESRVQDEVGIGSATGGPVGRQLVQAAGTGHGNVAPAGDHVVAAAAAAEVDVTYRCAMTAGEGHKSRSAKHQVVVATASGDVIRADTCSGHGQVEVPV